MAKRAYNRHYRMTAARRAALRKAQIASARKRRRNRRVAQTAGVVAVTAAAGGIGYSRGRKRRGSVNVVSHTMQYSNPKQAMKALPAAWDKSVDTQRWTYHNQVYDENDVMDYGRIGKQKPGYKQSFLPRRKPKGKPNTHVKSKRLNVVYSDGTILSGARQRWTEKQRMTYSPKKRNKAYVSARDRANPPAWLDPYQIKQKKRAAELRAKRAAQRAKKRGTGS